MNNIISQATVEQEIEDAKEYSELYHWIISPIDTEKQKFTVLLQSPIDQEKYLLEFGFDDYPEKPYLIDFIHPESGERGLAKCFPKSYDSFFHQQILVICHPCSRKAYQGYSNLHSDWNMTGWQKLAGGMTSLKYILDAIYGRISNKIIYHGGK
ncbi:MAG: hypothetical protein EOO89_30320 [Pedobacter sp.]|nr:MAG: hypothetical protein EOO89_30320 [Pedobacter sp.]